MPPDSCSKAPAASSVGSPQCLTYLANIKKALARQSQNVDDEPRQLTEPKAILSSYPSTRKFTVCRSIDDRRKGVRPNWQSGCWAEHSTFIRIASWASNIDGSLVAVCRIFLISVVQAPSNFWFPLIAAASPICSIRVGGLTTVRGLTLVGVGNPCQRCLAFAFSAAFYVLSLISIAYKRRVNREREKLGHSMNK